MASTKSTKPYDSKRKYPEGKMQPDVEVERGREKRGAEKTDKLEDAHPKPKRVRTHGPTDDGKGKKPTGSEREETQNTRFEEQRRNARKRKGSDDAGDEESTGGLQAGTHQEKPRKRLRNTEETAKRSDDERDTLLLLSTKPKTTNAQGAGRPHEATAQDPKKQQKHTAPSKKSNASKTITTLAVDMRNRKATQPLDLHKGSWSEREVLNLKHRGLKPGELQKYRQVKHDRITWLVEYTPNKTAGLVLFYSCKPTLGGPFDFLSNLYRCKIKIPDFHQHATFVCAEHVYQWSKAKYMAMFSENRFTREIHPQFPSQHLHGRIILAQSGTEAMNLGRSFDYYEKEDKAWWDQWRPIWEKNVQRAVYLAVKPKFEQNHELAILLLMTGDFELYEASQHDQNCGIGYHAGDALSNRDKWGCNLLGQTLQRVRDELRQHENYKKLPKVYHFAFWRLWEETCNEERDLQVERNMQEIAKDEKMDDQDKAWREKRNKQMAHLRESFEKSVVGDDEDFNDPATYEKWVSRLSELPDDRENPRSKDIDTNSNTVGTQRSETGGGHGWSSLLRRLLGRLFVCN